MVGQGRLVGTLLIAGGLLVSGVASLWLIGNWVSGQLQFTGFLLGLALILLVFAVPPLGVGGYLLVRGRTEEQEFAQVGRERKLLDIVQTRGQVRIPDLALEMRMTRDQVKDALYRVVGMGLFTGYVNWQEGILYAKEVAEVKTTKCPNCGGVRELVGKGVVKCPYCGVELFIS